MSKGVKFFVLMGAITCLVAPATAQPPTGETAIRVQRGIASIYKIDTDQPFDTVNIGDSKIADVVPLTDRSLIIQGHATGRTNMIFLDRSKTPIKEITVTVDEQGDGFIKVHNKALLNSYTAFSCWNAGCQFVGENTVAEPAPLPRGYQNLNQSINQGSSGLQPAAPISVPMDR